MMETCLCVGCGVELLEDDGAECSACGQAVVACTECVDRRRLADLYGVFRRCP